MLLLTVVVTLTIQAGAVESGMLNPNVISGQTELAHADIADADEFLINDNGSLKRVGVDNVRDHYYGSISGDATVADGGALTIASDAVDLQCLMTTVSLALMILEQLLLLIMSF